MSGSQAPLSLDNYVCPSGADSQDETVLALAMEKKANAAGLAESGKFQEAIALMTEALIQKPSSAMWWAFRADLYLKNKQWDHAAADASQALERNPDSARALRVRGMAHKQNSNWELAFKDLSASQNLDFNDGVLSAIQEVEGKAKESRDEKRKQERLKEEEEKAAKEEAAAKARADEEERRAKAWAEEDARRGAYRNVQLTGKLPVALHESTDNATDSMHRHGARKFYPGGPKWLDLPNFADVLIAESGSGGNDIKMGIMMAKQSYGTQRAADKAHRAKHQAKVACEFCGDSIKDEDPPECICGEIYCSDHCHAKDWKDHSRICDTIAENQFLAFSFTERYWRLVLSGYFPLKDEVDYVQLWKSNKNNSKKSGGASDPVPEYQFYGEELENYRAKFAAALAQFERGKRGEFKDDPARKVLAAHNFMSVVSIQTNRASTLFRTDSVARLYFKKALLDDCYRFQDVFQGSGLQEYHAPPKRQFDAEFSRLTRDKGKAVSLMDAYLKQNPDASKKKKKKSAEGKNETVNATAPAGGSSGGSRPLGKGIDEEECD